MRAPVLLLAALLTLSACGRSDPAPAATATSEPPSSTGTLTAGKADLVLPAGTYVSPQDFVPPLSLTVPEGWHSTHRGDDAFDLSRPAVGVDAPAVVLALITPTDDVVATALERMRKAATGKVSSARGTLVGQPASGFEEVGGSGELIASPSGTLALDADPKGHLLVLGADVDGVPLLAVVLVPDGTQWAAQRAAATAVLSSLTPG